jgi:predicted nucleic acid-binding protein
VRIALDSSVLIAAHISRAGVRAELLEDLLLHHEMVTSEFILEELGRKLLEKFSFPKREADQVAAFLRRVAVVVTPADLPSDVPGSYGYTGIGYPSRRRVRAAGERRS